MGLLDALQDKGFRSDVADGLRNALNRGLLGGVLGAPVDLATMALRPLGYKVAQPVMGSDWIGQKLQDAGMVSNKRNHLAEMMAGLLDPATMATGAVKAAAAAPMVAGMFIGKGAKTWDALQAAKALELEKAGTPARQIWSETGTWKGPDGMWRQEIDDSKAMFNTSTVNGKKIENDLTHSMGGVDLGPATSLIEHPSLKAAYDKSIAPSSFVENSRTMLGGDKGMFNGDSVTLYAPAKAKDAKSTLLHELQHAIQMREGFASGGNAQMAFNDSQAFTILNEIRRKMGSPMPVEQYAKDAWGSNVVTKEIADNYAKSYLPSIKKIPREFDVAAQETAAQEYYRRLAGEAEARATQARIPLDASQRRAIFPEDSYDVPVNQLIVRQDGLLGPQMATVWHGSPHQFNKFDASKIGTGEGAQAYGHGLYLAEDRGIADVYRKKLTGVDGAPVSSPNDSLQMKIGRLQFEVDKLRQSGDTSAPAMIRAYEGRIKELNDAGSLYKVDLPDDQIAKMLDWDKPMVDQPEAYLNLAKEKGLPYRGNTPKGGMDIYNSLVDELGGHQQATDLLRSQGIPGIRYLDGGSRGAGAGSSNFVVFPGNEDMLTILERNGQPVNALRGLLER